MEIEPFELRRMLEDCAEIAVKKFSIQTGLIKPYLKLSEAKALYGAATIERWIQEGLIKKKKDGPRNAMVRLDRMELETLAMKSNRLTYLATEERATK